jgi:hypothetical protein
MVISIVIIVIALSIIGLSNIINRDNWPNIFTISSFALGSFLSIFGNLLTGLKNALDGYLLDAYTISAYFIVGLKGLFGTILHIFFFSQFLNL